MVGVVVGDDVAGSVFTADRVFLERSAWFIADTLQLLPHISKFGPDISLQKKKRLETSFL